MRELMRGCKNLEIRVQDLQKQEEQLTTDIEILSFDYQMQEEKYNEFISQLQDMQLTLEKRKVELQLVEKNIELAQARQMTEEQRVQEEEKLKAAIDRYLHSDDTAVSYIRGLGKRRFKNKQGEISYRSVYDMYLEYKERLRKRAMGEYDLLRRPLPTVADDGGDGTTFRQNQGEQEYSM